MFPHPDNATETENIEEERGTEVAAAEQKENTTGTPDENGNYLINGSFEEPDFSGWTVTNNNDVTEELDVYDRETVCFTGAQSLQFAICFYLFAIHERIKIYGRIFIPGCITVGAHVATAPGGWGTIDDITLVKE